MEQILALIGPHLTLAAGGLAGLGVVVLGLLVAFVAKAAKPSAPVVAPPPPVPPIAPPPAAAAAAAPQVAMAEAPQGVFDRLRGKKPDGPAAAKAIRRAVAAALRESGPRPLNTPWVAMIGPPSSGKSAALHAVGGGRPLVDPDPGAGQDTHCGAWAFEQGVVFDVPGLALAWPEEGASSAAGDQTWRAFLEAVGKARPARPLDGVVLTIPADRLVGAAAMDRDALLAAGHVLHQRLRAMETWLGLRLPVYLLVTRCDAVPGFGGFWSRVPAERHQEMFGWSNPHSVDSAFTPTWIDGAFDELSVALRDVQMSLAAAAPPPGVDAASTGDIVLFPGAFADLRAPVRTLAGQVFQSTAYREGFFLRGVYFSGAVEQPGGLAPVLVRQLLTRKALLENGLVRPVVGRWTRRRRQIRRLQVAMGMLTVVLFAGLMWRVEALNHGLGTLAAPLEKIKESRAAPPKPVSHDSAGGDHWGEEAAATQMLKALGNIHLGGLTSPLIPASWFDGLEGRITAYARSGFNELIMGVIEERLDGEILYWLDSEPPTDKPDNLGIYGQRLADDVRAADALVASADLYGKVRAEGRGQDLRALVSNLFEISLAPDIDHLPEFISRALADGGAAPDQRFSLEGYRVRAEKKIATAAHLAFKAMSDSSQIAIDARALTEDLARLSLPSADAARALAQVRKRLDAIAHMMNDPWAAWVRSGAPQPDGQYDRVLRAIADNRLLGPDLATRLNRDAQHRVDQFRRELETHRAPLLDSPLFVTEEGTTTLVFAPPVEAFRGQLADLFAQPFMTAADPASLPDGVDVVWDPQGLDAALAIHRAWSTWRDTALGSFPPVLRPVVRAEAERRVGDLMVARVARSVSAVPPRRGILSERALEADFKAAVQSFRQASQPGALLITAFDEMGQDIRRDDMATALAATAYGLLGGLDHRLTRAGLYAPRRAAAAWDGTVPLTQVLFDAPDDKAIDLYLQDQRGRAHAIAVVDAGPPLAYLEQPGGSDTTAWEPLVRRWRLLRNDVDAYFAGQPGTALAALESFIRYDLPALTPATCGERLSALKMPPAASDPFAERHRALMGEVWERCDVLNGGDGAIGGAYSRIAGLFNAQLAGRYPFAAQPGGDGLAALTPDQANAFFAEYDRLRPSFDAELAGGGLTRTQRAAAQGFVRQMDAARAFLAPFADAKPGAPPPAYVLTPAFRTNTPYEKNANQILEWTLEVGAQTVREGMVTEAGTPLWQWGDPVRVRLRWAKDSPLLPFTPASGVPRVESPHTAVFAYEDPWALITLLRRHAPRPGQADNRDLPQPNLLAFAVPTRDPALAAGPTAGQVDALGFLRLGVLSADAPPPPAGTPAGTPPPTLVLPPFPVKAPELRLAGPQGGL